MIEFRPHHFLCTLGFEGKGYSESFVANFARLAAELRGSAKSGDAVSIRVVGKSDSICQPCPHRRGEKCGSESRIRALDDAHAEILGLRIGDELSWGEAKKLLAARMTVENFNRACAPCSWRELGLCKSALQKLHEESTGGGRCG